MPGISFTPEPQERAYYEALFRAADTQGAGNIGGAQAVQFFARSKLPVDVLKNIWTVADQPSTSSLDLRKFAVAVRLIQLTQNGQKGQGPALAVAEGVNLRPVFFEGVSGVTVALPPPPGGQPPPPTPSQQRPPPQQSNQQGPVSPHRQSIPPMPQMPQPPQTPASYRPPVSMPPQHMQQQPPQAPPTPMAQRQPQPMQQMNSPQSPPTRALVTQDPYGMTPQERARYEDLFPQYAKPDGFVYGKEAVELFMKSGVDQMILRDIWNMVDRPVDNRLDKLEFAMAMHLIVCISKKNLPPPRGTLPNSLKALKAAESQTPSFAAQARSQPEAPSQQQLKQQQHQPPPPQAPTNVATRIPSPPPVQSGMSAGMPSPSSQRYSIPPHGMTGGMLSQSSSFPPHQPGLPYDNQQQAPRSPPPVVAIGGMNISDAFEGLNAIGESLSQQPFAGAPVASNVPGRFTRFEVEEASSASSSPARGPTAPEAPPPSTRALVNNYDMGNANEELNKLKNVLQKLQAENISLKAQLGSMSEEEKEVQKELGATVAEIGRLSNDLQSLRSQVLSAKTRLLQASSELKSAHEHKQVLTGLIKEARDTKDAIEEATAAMESANEIAHHLEQQKNHALNKSDVFESNLFGFDGPSTSTPAPANSYVSERSAPHAPPTMSNASVASGDFSSYSQLSAPPPAPSSVPLVTTVSSSEEGHDQADVYDDNDDDDDGPDSFRNEFKPPQPAPVPTEQHSPPAQPERENMYHQVPPLQPSAALGRPQILSHQTRQSSLGFNPEFIMGGSAEPLASSDDDAGISPAARAVSDSSAYGYDDEESYKKVEELKKKAQMAAETARDAEAAHRKLLTEANELRQDADKAEATARSLKAAASEKKKGRFGGTGNKKKLMKDAERAQQDAQEIRQRFLSVQGQAKDAQAVAMETKREADKLRDQAEKAELEMASAASMREQTPTQQARPPPAAANSNGYASQHQGQPFGYGQPMGMPPSQSYGYGPPPGGYGQEYGQPPVPYSMPPQYKSMAPPPMEAGFASGVMGGGGQALDLPSPSSFGQPSTTGSDFSNPFSP